MFRKTRSALYLAITRAIHSFTYVRGQGRKAREDA